MDGSKPVDSAVQDSEKSSVWDTPVLSPAWSAASVFLLIVFCSAALYKIM